jgi:hypothetical protein
LQKIECPECLKNFIWTDDMPLKGKCPTPDCDWHYDVREELRRGALKRIPRQENPVLCSRCGSPLASRFAFCRGCGSLVTGPVTWGRGSLLAFILFLFLAVMIALYRYSR